LNHRSTVPTSLGLVSWKKPEVVPWETVCIDPIGPYPIEDIKNDANSKVISDTSSVLHAITMIDAATRWFKTIEVLNKRADYIANLFEQVWLSQYPWPAKVIMDHGHKFIGEVIDLLKESIIMQKATTMRNPQANAMVECAHPTIHPIK
jgi:hypothetical protein